MSPEILENLPIIPIVVLFLLLGFLIYELYLFFKNYSKNKTPEIPKVDYVNIKDIDETGQFVQKISAIKSLEETKKTTKYNRKSKNLVYFGLIIILGSSITGFSYFLQQTKIKTSSRASNIPTPILTIMPTEQTIEPTDSDVVSPSFGPSIRTLNQNTISKTPTNALLARNNSPNNIPTIINNDKNQNKTTPLITITEIAKLPTPTIITEPTITNKVEPTIEIVATDFEKKPTLAKTLPSKKPIFPTYLAKNFLTPTVILKNKEIQANPTIKEINATKATSKNKNIETNKLPTPTKIINNSKEIPQTGLTLTSLALLTLSLALLAIGFVL